MKLKLPFSDKNLHWTTVTSEKVLLAIIGIATCIAAAQYLFQMYEAREILLADLFLLFIYVEIIGMVGAFYSTNRITLSTTEPMASVHMSTVTTEPTDDEFGL